MTAEVPMKIHLKQYVCVAHGLNQARSNRRTGCEVQRFGSIPDVSSAQPGARAQVGAHLKWR